MEKAARLGEAGVSGSRCVLNGRRGLRGEWRGMSFERPNRCYQPAHEGGLNHVLKVRLRGEGGIRGSYIQGAELAWRDFHLRNTDSSRKKKKLVRVYVGSIPPTVQAALHTWKCGTYTPGSL